MRTLLYFVAGVFLVLLVFLIFVRIVRHFYKFPMPSFFANLIDNPLRRRIQPPDAMTVRHHIEPGMTVLEIGPGNGTYTLATARRVGDHGKVVAVDIEPKMVERVVRRAQAEGVTNIEAWVADVYQLPFEDGLFDAVYMIAVIGEIPHMERALMEIRRVLSPAGTLAFSELLPDPDYPLAKILIRRVTSCGFSLINELGNVFSYTLVFGKDQI
jgi:ubiquinone/menaquinone biosynthesis C-methylase UbiE